MMKDRKILIRILSFVLSLTVILIPTLISVNASGTDGVEYDYSKPGSYFNTTLTAADVIELLGYEVSDAERSYVESMSSICISYDTVTNQYVTVLTEDGITRVTAYPYTYVSANGDEVSWIPTSASIGATESDFVLKDGEYVADFGQISYDDDSYVDVKYEFGVTFVIGKDDVNDILNLAYLNAPGIKHDVESARSEYEAALKRYEDYFTDNADALLKYEDDVVLYEKYLIDKLIYDEKNAAYLAYLEDCKVYADQLDLYNKYLVDLEAYNDIIENNRNYDSNYANYLLLKAEYEGYLANMLLVKEQIKMLDEGLMNKSTYLKRQLYSSLLSNLVNRVTDNKEIFLIYFDDFEQLFDDCAAASKKVKEILTPRRGTAYNKLETEEDKYAFYVNNFYEFRDAILVLTKTLHRLYSNNELRKLMHSATAFGEEEYTEKFSIFISQLIYFSNAISDEPVMDYTGKFVLDENITLSYWDSKGVEVKNRKVIDILEGNRFVESASDVDPIIGGYPSEVSEPIPPVLLDEPEKPQYVARPIEPDEIAPAGEAPEVVEEPKLPDGYCEKPVRPEIIDNEIYDLLIADYDLGLICGREELDEDLNYTPIATVRRSISEMDLVTVKFTDGNGNTLSEVSVSKGTAVSYSGELPKKPEDLGSTYVFDAWIDSEGNKYNLASVGEDVTLYPGFRTVDKNYSIEYDANSKTNYLDVRVESTQLDHIPLERFIYRAKMSAAGIRFTASNICINLGYSDILTLDDLGVESLDISVGINGGNTESCLITAKNGIGESVSVPVGISVTVPCSDSSYGTGSQITYSDAEGNVKPVQKTYSNYSIKFKAYAGRLYTLAVRYAINVSPSLADKVKAPIDATPGETVRIEVDIPLGISAEIYYLVDSDNGVKHIIEDFSFVMPNEHVVLKVVYTEILYTVTFMYDGKIYQTGKYKYGDTVRIPNAPTKVNDGEYTYTFKGWSPIVGTVSSDAVYVAEFDSVPIPKETQKYPWLKPVIYSAITLFVLMILLVVILILNKKGVINVKGIMAAIFRKKPKSSEEPDASCVDTEEKNDQKEE